MEWWSDGIMGPEIPILQYSSTPIGGWAKNLRRRLMLSNEENEVLTRVGPGTPAGEMLRRYWWPVGFSEHVTAKGRPVKVRLLGEDLVLFRDGDRRLGVLALHCSHRGTS